MRTLPTFHFIVYCVIRAVRHPRATIYYHRCECGCRFPASSNKCPKCGDKVGSNPGNRQESPVPWWCAMLCILMGVGVWIVSALLNISPLGEAARFLVYVPLGHLFGMSLRH
ncbi:hypothetical protein ES703_63194 [subsurface metagenome]